MFAQTLLELVQWFPVTLEKRAQHEIVLTVGEGSLASGSARSLGGLHRCRADLIGMDRGEELSHASTDSVGPHSSMTLILRVP